jgi:hypothetical protein
MADKRHDLWHVEERQHRAASVTFWANYTSVSGERAAGVSIRRNLGGRLGRT